VSSEGDHRGEEGAIWARRWGVSASIKRLTTLVAHSVRVRILSHEEPDALTRLPLLEGFSKEPALIFRTLRKKVATTLP
jgi:hypothetical protein